MLVCYIIVGGYDKDFGNGQGFYLQLEQVDSADSEPSNYVSYGDYSVIPKSDNKLYPNFYESLPITLGKWDTIQDYTIFQNTVTEAYDSTKYDAVNNTYNGITEFILSPDRTIVCYNAGKYHNLIQLGFSENQFRYKVWNKGREQILSPKDENGMTSFDTNGSQEIELSDIFEDEFSGNNGFRENDNFKFEQPTRIRGRVTLNKSNGETSIYDIDVNTNSDNTSVEVEENVLLEINYDNSKSEYSAMVVGAYNKDGSYLGLVTGSLTVTVEAEIGHIGGEEDGVVGTGECADPAECKAIADLGVTMLAAGIGNIHGKYPANWAGLSFETLDAIQQLTKDMPLVLHGGTGIPEDMIKKAISLGVAKINVNTECQLAFQEATRKYIEAGKDLEGKGFDPRKLLAPGFEAIKATVKEKMELFGSVNKA